MGIFNLFKPKKQKQLLEPLKGKQNEVHFVKVTKFNDGEIVAFAFFPNFKNDYFGVEIIKDDFTNLIITQPYYIHSRKSDKILLFSKYNTVFNIGLRTKKEQDFLTMEAYQKEIKFSIGDKLNILFENGEIVELEISKNGKRISKDSDGVIFESEIHINSDLVEQMKETAIKKIKFQDLKNNQDYAFNISSENKNLIKEMALMMSLVKNLSMEGL